MKLTTLCVVVSLVAQAGRVGSAPLTGAADTPFGVLAAPLGAPDRFELFHPVLPFSAPAPRIVYTGGEAGTAPPSQDSGAGSGGALSSTGAGSGALVSGAPSSSGEAAAAAAWRTEAAETRRRNTVPVIQIPTIQEDEKVDK